MEIVESKEILKLLQQKDEKFIYCQFFDEYQSLFYKIESLEKFVLRKEILNVVECCEKIVLSQDELEVSFPHENRDYCDYAWIEFGSTVIAKEVYNLLQFWYRETREFYN